MKKPVLVIMAAGMGSRYGGLKQIDTIDEHGHIIIDFSIYDALKAGFEKFIFVIKKEDEKDFMEVIGKRIKNVAKVEYVYQELNNLPKGYKVPEDRVKPWGTAHAILSCADKINEPFVVINSDDYYGINAFKMAYDYLLDNKQDGEKSHYMMVGYTLENTLTDNGYVSRGVCITNENGYLTEINERTHIQKKEDGIYYKEDNEDIWVKIPEKSTVSMNMWGFSNDILIELENRFEPFLKQSLLKNPLKCEYFLPFVVGEILAENKADIKVLKSNDKWYGVTYKEDKQIFMNAIKELKKSGLYPDKLWEERNEY